MGECDGFGLVAEGVHAGAWENATRPGSPFGDRWMAYGVPVGPRVEALLGTPANVTSVRWRVDGGPVEEVEGEPWAGNQLASPEYLELSFWDVPVVRGTLSPDRDSADAAAVVERFLDVVRGERPDNVDLAASYAPWLQGGGVQVVWTDPEGNSNTSPRTEEPEPLPDGPWAISSLLAAHADAKTLRLDEPRFVDGAWAWSLSVPDVVSGTTFEPGASWYVRVDALDRVTVAHGSNVTLDEAAFRGRLERVLPSLGIVGADLDGWVLHLEAGYGALCPEPSEQVTASP